jgi:Fur family ferric uptake transcriptional regulator
MRGTSPELQVFRKYLAGKRLKQTPHRMLILQTFVSNEGHRSVEDIYNNVRKADPHVGYTTIYRTMKLLSDAGLAREVDLGDGMTRYEHLYNHKHHDHMICTKCGQSIEFFNAEIEKLQDDASEKLGFRVQDHRLQIYGLCKACRN